MGAAAGARRAEIQLPWLLLGERDQLGDGFDAHRGRDNEHVRLSGKRHDLDEILRRIEGQVGIDRRVVGVRRGMHHQRIAVGRRLRDNGRADGPASTGSIVDNDRLTPQLGKLLAKSTRQDVGGAAGGEWHDDVHWFARIRLAGRLSCRLFNRQERPQHCHTESRETACKFHAWLHQFRRPRESGDPAVFVKKTLDSRFRGNDDIEFSQE